MMRTINFKNNRLDIENCIAYLDLTETRISQLENKLISLKKEQEDIKNQLQILSYDQNAIYKGLSCFNMVYFPNRDLKLVYVAYLFYWQNIKYTKYLNKEFEQNFYQIKMNTLTQMIYIMRKQKYSFQRINKILGLKFNEAKSILKWFLYCNPEYIDAFENIL